MVNQKKSDSRISQAAQEQDDCIRLLTAGEQVEAGRHVEQKTQIDGEIRQSEPAPDARHTQQAEDRPGNMQRTSPLDAPD